MSERPDLEPGILTAAAMIEWRRAGGLSLPRTSEAVVFTHQGSLLGRRMPWARPNRRSALSVNLAKLPGVTGVSLALAGGIGGPAASLAIEELAVAGVKRLVSIDICGSLDPSAPCGKVVLVDRAIAADGTSSHYTSESSVTPSAGLTEALGRQLGEAGVDYLTGAVWTTDAAYRETRSLVDKHRANGAVVVDMEAAAVLAVAEACGIEAAMVLVATDELSGEWQPPRDMAAVNLQLRRVLPAAIAALRA